MARWRHLAAATAAIMLMSQAPARAEPALSNDWTVAAAGAVAPLAELNPGDAAEFCPAYATLAPDQRRAFWVDFLIAVAQAESGQDPTLSRFHAMDRDAGRPTFRRGLLQISIESANRPAYACGVADPKGLLDPATNVACGVKILAYWIGRDGVIAGGDKQPLGGGRYWPTLARPVSRAAIAGRTSASAECGLSDPDHGRASAPGSVGLADRPG